jgi:integrase
VGDLDLEVPQLRVAAALTSAGGQLRLKGTKTRKVRLCTSTRTPRRCWQGTAPASGAPPAGVHPARRQPVAARGGHGPLARAVARPRAAVHPLHDLRHTHATLLLQAGLPIKVVSERLGHSRVAMTLDVYAHVLPAMDRAAADAIGALVRSDSV